MQMGGYDHFTGRFCSCGGRLLHSCIDFGQNLPPEPLELAIQHSSEADVHLVLGSSLLVRPACDMPRTTGKKSGAHLIICNLQKTPLDDVATSHVFAECDTLMTMLMQELNIEIPSFRLHRRILARHCSASETTMIK